MSQFKKQTLPSELALDVRLALTTTMDYVLASVAPSSLLAKFEQVRTWCIFIGYPRSGHSLIGSVIDAHPNAAVSHRLNSLSYLQRGMHPRQIFYLIWKNSARFAKAGRALTGYSYSIPGQWQGRHQELHLLGDQEGDKSVRLLQTHPELLDQLHRFEPIKAKFVHVIRNPYDNISTIAMRTYRPLSQAMDRYFSLCEAVADVKRRVAPDDIIDVRHDTFVQHPRSTHRELMQFLGLPVTDAYLDDCASIVHPTPTQSRHLLPWSEAEIDQVRRRAERYAFLRDYAYHEPAAAPASSVP